MPVATQGKNITDSTQINTGVVTGADIANDTIENADIKSTAAIDRSKLSGVAASGANTDITSLGGLTTPLSVAQGGTGLASGNTNKFLKFTGATTIGEGDPGVTSFKSGVTTRALNTASGNQTIAHGLGTTPLRVKITVIEASTSGHQENYSFGSYDGTNNRCVFRGKNNNAQYYVGNDASNSISIYHSGSNDTLPSTGTITVDATNITIAWTKAASATGTAYILWEVEG